ncbi:glycosyltransferase [Marixanthomonas spongiae]|uniref:Glycosyltransferase n=1 Tax=Marixanthomonas spongiae TaxID=2174845 RepID=A0A2U0HZF4_9FLAO|nr:glycosyltransferase [Marixanthomonas spongiae]PVW14218.1 glycosyltransferase [Marixanthomonas spongiae]
MMISGVLLFTIYLVLLLAIWIGMIQLKSLSSKPVSPKTNFSIVVPFRNEANNLTALVTSLKQLDYPAHFFEVIFVDDVSKDRSVFVLSQALEGCVFPYKIIRSKRFSNSPKKDAITLAVSEAKHPWILTTDADCKVPVTWLRAFNSIIQEKHPNMVCGPVYYHSNGSLVHAYQQCDGLSLQAVTMGGFGLNRPFLCNGANLGYKKDLFQQLKGFSGNNHIASGDDIFMMENIQQLAPNTVHFLKSNAAVVTTQPQKKWRQVINQRVRWASKTAKQKNWLPKVVGGLVFATNLWFVFGWIFVFFSLSFRYFFLFLFFMKVLIDGIIILLSAHSCLVNRKVFRKKTISAKFIFQMALSGFLYPFITVTVFVLSLLGGYKWKGRRYKT